MKHHIFCILAAMATTTMAATGSDVSNTGTTTTIGSTTTNATDDPYIRLWMTPSLLMGFLVTFFLLAIAAVSFSLLGAIQVPPYQLPANDEKNKENNREWQNIWGNIQKS